jgi:hypothetical protein
MGKTLRLNGLGPTAILYTMAHDSALVGSISAACIDDISPIGALEHSFNNPAEPTEHRLKEKAGDNGGESPE